MAATTTLKLPKKLKTRIARLAKKFGCSADSFVADVLEREVTYLGDTGLVQEALAGKDTIARGTTVYRAEDVHVWLDRFLADKHGKRRRPRHPPHG